MPKTSGSWMWRGLAMSVMAVVVLVAGSTAIRARQADQAELLMQAARNKQVVEGKLDEAIKIYQDVLAKYEQNRPVAARALAELGQCYEKLGATQTAEARKSIRANRPAVPGAEGTRRAGTGETCRAVRGRRHRHADRRWP